MRFLFLAFIIIPILEMWLLIKVGAIIGPSMTIALVLLTAVIGSFILRQQGFATLLRAQQRLQEGQLPANEIIEGLILAVSGALLLTPGFVTDAWGFIGLLPFTRIPLVKWLKNRVGPAGFQFYASSQVSGAFQQQNSSSKPQDSAHNNPHNTIDGECWKEDD